MANGESEGVQVANPNRITTDSWRDLYVAMGKTGIQKAGSNTQLTPEDIEELTTRVD